MNYLAHISLAFPDPGLIGGNYLYDMIHNAELKNINPYFKQGIELHKWIDHFSNNNIHLREMNSFLHPVIHKYAPVASDILCDYILYLNWERYFDIPFEAFENSSYKILDETATFMPTRIQIICLNMIRHRWLSQYKSLDGIVNVLKRTNTKTKFSVDLTTSVPVLEENLSHFRALFHAFYLECKKTLNANINLQNEMKS